MSWGANEGAAVRIINPKSGHYGETGTLTHGKPPEMSLSTYAQWECLVRLPGEGALGFNFDELERVNDESPTGRDTT